MNVYFIFRTEERKCNFVRQLKTLVLGICFSLFLYGCNDNLENENMEAVEMNNVPSISESTRKELRAIQNKKIIFAHHSVGKNILDGLHDIMMEAGIDINVVSINHNVPKDKLKFVDFNPGKNTQPKTKIDSFVSKIQELGSDYVPDIAFMKFCYIDFLQETDVDAVFTYYKKNLIMLKNKRPDIKFVHFTAPLMKRSDDFKVKIMRLIGRDHWIDVTNVKRAKFNELLLKTFSNDPVFDIAKIESTHLDGSRQEFLYKEQTYNSMVPEYTDDGGHLNILGQRVVAKEFIHFLAHSLN